MNDFRMEFYGARGKKEAGFKDMGHTKKGVEEKAIESKE